MSRPKDTGVWSQMSGQWMFCGPKVLNLLAGNFIVGHLRHRLKRVPTQTGLTRLDSDAKRKEECRWQVAGCESKQFRFVDSSAEGRHLSHLHNGIGQENNSSIYA
jgi:hypothetical protein